MKPKQAARTSGNDSKRLARILFNYLATSTDDFAKVYRDASAEHLQDILVGGVPTKETHLCVDLKTIRLHEPFFVGACVGGFLCRDSNGHFTFYEEPEDDECKTGSVPPPAPRNTPPTPAKTAKTPRLVASNAESLGLKKDCSTIKTT